MNRRLTLDNATGLLNLRIGLLVSLDHVDILDKQALVLQHPEHMPALTLAASGYHDDLIALANTLHAALLTILPSPVTPSSRTGMCAADGASVRRYACQPAQACC